MKEKEERRNRKILKPITDETKNDTKTIKTAKRYNGD